MALMCNNLRNEINLDPYLISYCKWILKEEKDKTTLIMNLLPREFFTLVMRMGFCIWNLCPKPTKNALWISQIRTPSEKNPLRTISVSMTHKKVISNQLFTDS